MVEMLDLETANALRASRKAEIGTEPPCPFCQRPRVRRSDYIRCNPCGVNWLAEEMHLTYKGRPYLEVDPRLARRVVVPTASSTKPTADTSKVDAE